MAKYRAIQSGYAQPVGLTFARYITRGEVFEYDGPASNIWMQPLDDEARSRTPPPPKRRNPMLHRSVGELAPYEPLPGQKPASSKHEGPLP